MIGARKRAKALPERLVHGVRWRLAAFGNRVRARQPHFMPVLRELRATTKKPVIELTRGLVAARQRHGMDARTFARLMLWDVPRERWGDFILAPELTKLLAATLDPEDRALSRDKAAFAEHDRKHGVAWPPTLAVINRREGVPIEGAAVVDKTEYLWPLLATLSVDRDLVLKPSCGERGSGFVHVSRSGLLRGGRGTEIARDAVTEMVFSYRHRLGSYGYIAQPALAPDPAMVQLTGIDALVTARIVTAVKNGVPGVLESFVKIPAPGGLTDNFLRGVTGTVMAGFDHETGRLTELVGLLRPGNRYVIEHAAVHPVTGRRIAGEQLPSWRAAVEIACRAAMAHPRTATLGWDIAMTSSGCMILDGNPNWGSGRQLCWREGVRPTLARMFPEYFR